MGRPLGAFSSLLPLTQLEQFKHYGLDCVQWEPSPAAMQNDGDAYKEIQMFRDAGLAIVALVGYRNIVTPDRTKKAAVVKDMQRLFELAAMVGAGTGVATETGTKNAENQWLFHPDNLSEASWQELLETVKAFLEMAEGLDVKLLLEGYVENVLRTADDIRRFRKAVQSPALGFVMDPFNLLLEEHVPQQEGEQSKIFETVADLSPIAHAKDVLYTDGVVGTPRSGKGVFNFTPYFRLLEQQLPGVPLIVEHLSAEEIPEVLSFLQRAYDEASVEDKAS